MSKTNFPECLNPHFSLYDILPMTRLVILTTIMTEKIEKFIKKFLKVVQIVRPTSQLRHNKGGISHLITLIIKSTCSRSLRFRKFFSFSFYYVMNNHDKCVK